jgi:hypothetical protein
LKVVGVFVRFSCAASFVAYDRASVSSQKNVLRIPTEAEHLPENDLF